MQANKSSILAIIANKIGDIALLIAMTLVYYSFKTNSFYLLNSIFIYIRTTNIDLNHFLEISMILFVIACIGKSAQFGFHF